MLNADDEDLLNKFNRPKPKYTLLVGLIVVVVMVCLGLLGIRYFFSFIPPIIQVSPKINNPYISQLVALNKSLLFFVAPNQSSPDLFRYSPTTSPTVINISQSPTLTETFPSLSPDGVWLMYVGTDSTGQANIYVQEVISPTLMGQVYPLTLNIGQTALHTRFEIDLSYPPLWSPDSLWIAFLVRQVDGLGDAKDVYAVNRTNGDIVALTTGHQIHEITWVSDTTLTYIDKERTGQNVIAHIDRVQPTPTVIYTYPP